MDISGNNEAINIVEGFAGDIMDEKKKKIELEYRHKLMVLAFVSVILLVSYFFVRYLLPLVWPFVVGVLIAATFKPLVTFLNRKLRINMVISTAIVIALAMSVLGYLFAVIFREFVSQVEVLVQNFDEYLERARGYLDSACDTVGRAVGVNGDGIYESISGKFFDYVLVMEEKLTTIVMGTSLPVILGIIEVVISTAVIIVFIFLYIKDIDKIKDYFRSCYFHKEVYFVAHRIFNVIKAYVKAEFVIMLLVCAECSIGLFVLGNSYALLIGSLVGLLDALPLFGVGTVLIPWTILYLLTGNFVKAAIIFTVFIVCYFTREFLEPRLVGDKIGINPIVTLVIIYAGFRLFGFVGMFIAPLIFVVVRDATNMFIKFIKT